MAGPLLQLSGRNWMAAVSMMPMRLMGLLNIGERKGTSKALVGSDTVQEGSF